MAIDNELLDEKIKESIDDARIERPKPKDRRKPILFAIVILIVAFVALFSLLRNVL